MTSKTVIFHFCLTATQVCQRNVFVIIDVSLQCMIAPVPCDNVLHCIALHHTAALSLCRASESLAACWVNTDVTLSSADSRLHTGANTSYSEGRLIAESLPCLRLLCRSASHFQENGGQRCSVQEVRDVPLTAT